MDTSYPVYCLKNNRPVQGLSLGSSTAVVCSFFDCIFVLRPSLYIPWNFFLILFLFNSVFYCLLGLFTGSALKVYERKNGSPTDNENRLWILFFSYRLVFFTAFWAVQTFHL